MAGLEVLVLDTTYVLPLFGVKPQISPTFPEELDQLWEVGIPTYRTFLPSVCLMEVAYKLNQEFRLSKQVGIVERYSLILPTVLISPVVTVFHPHIDRSASQVAMKIRAAGHADLIDCWIAASAASLNGILITEDAILAKILRKLPETSNIQCWTWKALQNHIGS